MRTLEHNFYNLHAMTKIKPCYKALTFATAVPDLNNNFVSVTFLVDVEYRRSWTIESEILTLELLTSLDIIRMLFLVAVRITARGLDFYFPHGKLDQR